MFPPVRLRVSKTKC